MADISPMLGASLMQRVLWVFSILALATFFVLRPSPSRSKPDENQPVHKAFGIEKRELWTTSNVKGSPEPPAPYQMVKVYPKLSFNEPLELIPVPGREAWVVAERKGKIFSFAADPAKAEKKLLIDLGHIVYGIAFHPQFQKNGYVYI